MRWFFKRSPAKTKNPELCGYCKAPAVGSVHGWPLCASHLNKVLRR